MGYFYDLLQKMGEWKGILGRGGKLECGMWNAECGIKRRLRSDLERETGRWKLELGPGVVR
jgi:hypothetical protein